MAADMKAAAHKQAAGKPAEQAAGAAVAAVTAAEQADSYCYPSRISLLYFSAFILTHEEFLSEIINGK